MFGCQQALAQEAAAIDSIKRSLATATTPEEKVTWMDNLARVLMNVNPAQGDSMGKKLIEYAEETRDRKLMVKAYVSSGLRSSYFGGNKIRSQQAIDFYAKALAIARDSKLEEEVGGVQLRMAAVYLNLSDPVKALNFVNQASSVIATLKNDSLQAECQQVYGLVYLARNEKILALRYFLNALRIAEEIKNNALMRSCYLNLSRFYAGIEAYDKAIDYAMLAHHQLDKMKESSVPYQRVIDMSSIGNLYAQKKNYDIAINYFERSIAMADTLKFSSLRLPGYMNIFNQYLRMDQPQKALDFFNSSKGLNLQAQLRRFGMASVIDQAFGVTYTALNRFDSARFYLTRAAPFFEKTTNDQNKMYFYHNLGQLYKKTGETDKAIGYYIQLKEMGERNGALENVEFAARELDTLYALKGNYLLSREYNRIYHQYKDSIETMSKEKELAQEEAADEQQRMVRLQKEKEEQDRRRNNIQYMAITFGIVGLFIALVVLGMFKVSAGAIRAIGFFAFLLFFEFLFLIFKKNIYSITHGEPWKDLAFMIALAALLVPLHHWLEKKVLHYLTSHNRLTRAGQGLKQRIFRRSRSPGD